MKKFFLIIIILSLSKTLVLAKDELSVVDNLFHIDQMNSHNENFALYFKTREKAILARGEKSNYICLLYTSPSPRDGLLSRMPSSA